MHLYIRVLIFVIFSQFSLSDLSCTFTAWFLFGFCCQRQIFEVCDKIQTTAKQVFELVKWLDLSLCHKHYNIFKDVCDIISSKSWCVIVTANNLGNRDNKGGEWNNFNNMTSPVWIYMRKYIFVIGHGCLLALRLLRLT